MGFEEALTIKCVLKRLLLWPVPYLGASEAKASNRLLSSSIFAAGTLVEKVPQERKTNGAKAVERVPRALFDI